MQWNSLTKLIFRFGACYIFLYTMSNQFFLSFAFEAVWQKVTPWFAEHILQLSEPITVFTNGSGDTTYNWVSLLVYLSVSAIATIIWSSLDAKRPNYEKMMQWLIILVRYYIISQMISYGLAKVFYMQFRPPMFMRLIQSYGDSSPMGILWTFMGFSKGYTVFAGMGELVGGLLLLFNRTRTLGAFVVFGVMINVMMMNYCYDVPVKILSTHLVLLSVFLISLDLPRLWKVFILNEPVGSAFLPPLFPNPKHQRIKTILKWVLVIGWLGYTLYSYWENNKKWGLAAPKPVLYGLYEVESFERNGTELPPLTTDSTRWDKLAIDWKDRAMIQYMNGKRSWSNFIPDSTAGTILYYTNADTMAKDTFIYRWTDSTHIHLEGIHQGDTLYVRMKTKKKEDFLLMNRGFNWINEYPFNR